MSISVCTVSRHLFERNVDNAIGCWGESERDSERDGVQMRESQARNEGNI